MALYVHPFVPAGAAEAPGSEIDRMIQMTMGVVCTAIARAAAVHGLADRAAEGEVTAAGFAASAGLDTDACVRFLRGAVAVGLLEPTGTDAYRGTALLDTLRTDRPDSLRDVAALMGAGSMSLPWQRLAEVLRTGHDASEDVFGTSFFGYLTANPDARAEFARGMSTSSSGVVEPLAQALDLTGVNAIVDVGGGDGNVLRAVLGAHSGVTGTVFDLPHVVPFAAETAEQAGLGDRLGVVAGDMFADAVPPADLCLLKAVLHDWSDDECVAILSRCRDAVAPHGRVAVLEQIIGDTGGIGPVMDLMMLVMLPGRERTRAEYTDLFTRAGLRLDSVTDTGTAISVLTASPA